MRAILLGNKNLAVRALDLLPAHGIEVVGVVLNPDDDGIEQGRWYQSLKRAAAQRGLPTIQPRNVSSDEGRQFIEQRRPDWLLSISYSRIVRKEILDLPLRMPLNIHFSMLPHNRGCLPLVYAMASGSRQTGVSLHVMDEGIDTGDVLAQRAVPIDESDTARSMYFKCVDAAEALLDQALPRLVEGSLRAQPQVLEDGSYHRQVYPNDRWLNPDVDPRGFSCFVRAHTFPPYPTARVMVAGVEHPVLFQDGAFRVPGLGIGPGSAAEVLELLRNCKWEPVCPRNLASTS